MQKSKFKVSYDKKSDDLFIYLKNEKSQASVEIGEVILDISNKGKLVAVEIQSASEWLSSISNLKVYKKDLEKISKAEIKISNIRNSLIIKVVINTPEKLLINPIVIPNLGSTKIIPVLTQ